nr:transmembrane protease serine 12-like [Zootoca vivipara]
MRRLRGAAAGWLALLLLLDEAAGENPSAGVSLDSEPGFTWRWAAEPAGTFSRVRFSRVRSGQARPSSLGLEGGLLVASGVTGFPSQCGTRPLVDEASEEGRIVGGRDTEPGRWPWQVSLQVYRTNGRYSHVCAGSLIDYNSVLTAAHCVKNRTAPELWRAVFGLHQLYGDKIHSISSRVMEIRPHCRYTTRRHVNDIALFKLSQVITYSDYIQPICLPSTPLLLSDRNPCYISGWGLTEEKGKPRNILQEAQLRVFPLKVCNSYGWHNGRLSRNQLCAGSESGHVDTCMVK